MLQHISVHPVKKRCQNTTAMASASLQNSHLFIKFGVLFKWFSHIIVENLALLKKIFGAKVRFAETEIFVPPRMYIFAKEGQLLV